MFAVNNVRNGGSGEAHTATKKHNKIKRIRELLCNILSPLMNVMF